MFGNTRSDVKKCALKLLRKKENNMSGKSYILYIPQPGTFTYKRYPCYWRYRWKVILCGVPVVGNTFPDDGNEW